MNKLAFLSIWLFWLPGTILHELSHYVIALILNGRPYGFSIIPHVNRDGNIELGSVKVTNVTWYNAFWIGLAPLVCMIPLSVTLLFVVNDYLHDTFAGIIVGIIVCFYFIRSSIPSKEDIRLVFSNYGYVLYGILIVLFVYYSHINSYFQWLIQWTIFHFTREI